MHHVPDDVALPLTTGHDWWHWLGGRPSIDLLNTRRERWRRDIETLVTPTDMTEWLYRARLLDDAHDASPAQLRNAHRLRRAIDECLLAVVAARPIPRTAVADINRQIPDATTAVLLHCDGTGQLSLAPVIVADPIDHALGRLAVDAAAILGSDLRTRVRICAADRCSTRFYDASRAGTRQWCSMSGCGNAAKAQRHRARQAGNVDGRPARQ